MIWDWFLYSILASALASFIIIIIKDSLSGGCVWTASMFRILIACERSPSWYFETI